MKKYLLTILLLVTFTGFTQTDSDNTKGKSIVYFTQVNSLSPLSKTYIFDKDKILGRTESRKYFKYVCEPGKHFFWGVSSNRSGVEINLKPDKIYFIDIVMFSMGINVLMPEDASITLKVLKKKSKNKIKLIKKLLRKKKPISFTDKDLKKWKKNRARHVKKMMKLYNKFSKRKKHHRYKIYGTKDPIDFDSNFLKK